MFPDYEGSLYLPGSTYGLFGDELHLHRAGDQCFLYLFPSNNVCFPLEFHRSVAGPNDPSVVVIFGLAAAIQSNFDFFTLLDDPILVDPNVVACSELSTKLSVDVVPSPAASWI